MFFRDQNALDGRPIGETEQKLDRAVAGFGTAHDPRPADEEFRLQRFAHGARQIRHFVKGERALLEQPLADLLGAIGGMMMLEQKPRDFIGAQIFDVGLHVPITGQTLGLEQLVRLEKE